MKKILTVLITLLLLSVSMFTVFADGYTYTLTISADGQVVYKLDNLKYGSVVSLPQGFVQNLVTPSDSRYYTKGVKKAGYDNAEAQASYTVTEDLDLVVFYGLKSSQVSYTVRFVDGSGNQLLADQTFYGNVGEKAVASYQYIDGYVPQAYNLAMTLKDKDNVFTFVYSPDPTGTYRLIDLGTQYIIGPTVVVNGGTTPAPATPADNTPADNTPAETVVDNTTPQTNTPEEIIDIDNSTTPTANPGNSISIPLMVGGACAVAGLGGLVFFLLKRKKDEDEEETAEE
ncbi:MAG: hypothetical protein Q4D13_00170 [Erysipelotrichaceae bacterium]|nr:hypothetical protein [Erysipelotrichaceae bacterium]